MFRVRELVDGENQPEHKVNSTSETLAMSQTVALVTVRLS